MITFDLFDSILQSVQEKDERIGKISEVLGGAEELFAISAIDEVLRLMTDVLDDTNEYIFFWVWELRFGKEWTPCDICDDKGRFIKLQTTRDLYALLMGDPVYITEDIND